MEDDFESLKCRVSEMEEKNGRLEVEIRRLKDVVEDGVGLAGESGERSGLFEVMVENIVLKCGKRIAEEEVKELKEKIIELEARVAQLEKDGVVNGMRKIENGVGVQSKSSDEEAGAGEEAIDLKIPCVGEPAPSTTKDSVNGILNLNTPSPVTPYTRRGNTICERESDSLDGLTARRNLVYNHERSPSPTVSPGQQARVNSGAVGIIAISDSEEDNNATRKNIHVLAAMNSVSFNPCFDDDEVFVSGSLKRSFVDSSSDEHLHGLKESATPKRKRVSNIVASDSGSDDIPIGMLLKKNVANHEQKSSSEDEVGTILTDAAQLSVPQRRQRLMSLSQRCGANGTGRSRAADRNSSKYGSGVHCATEIVADDDLEETELESEGESLGGFIVKSSDSDSGNVSTNDCCSDENDVSVGSHLQADSDLEYAEIISKLRRDKDHKMQWELEGDMLAAFGKDPDLCLKAVCALYRQQTSDEKQCKGTIHANGRGFNQLDALRGSKLAEFLTDGDPSGPVRKSAEELEKYQPNGVEVCRDLAERYSKQLFTIFQNKEDPLFHPAV